MNTTEVGDIFELKVYNQILDDIDKGIFPVNLKNSKIFHKKSYYSENRKSNIVFDIAIEVYVPETQLIFVIILIECKNYTSPIPVNDIEEFHSKINQIGSDNTKGMFITQSNFQLGAFEFAKSNGIALLRINEESRLKWILARTNNSYYEGAVSNISLDTVQDYFVNSSLNEQIEYVGWLKNHYTLSFSKTLSDLIFEDPLNPIDLKLKLLLKSKTPPYKEIVPFIDQNEIDKLISSILIGINYNGGTVDFNNLVDYVSNVYNISINYIQELGTDRYGFGILGRISFEERNILISSQLNRNFHRLKFTVAHEIGHLILEHNKYLIREFISDYDYEDVQFNDIGVKDIKRLEWQANYFASNILLPNKYFIPKLNDILINKGLFDRGYGLIFVDEQDCNLFSFYEIINTLKNEFNISGSVIEKRLNNLNILKDHRNKRR